MALPGNRAVWTFTWNPDAVAGVIGTLQATEALKELLGLGSSLAGRLLIYDALDTNFRKIAVPRDPGCALCGASPTILPPAP